MFFMEKNEYSRCRESRIFGSVRPREASVCLLPEPPVYSSARQPPFRGSNGRVALNSSDTPNGHHDLGSRFAVHPTSEGGRSGVDCRVAGALEHVSPRAVYGRTRPGPKTKTHVVYDAAADCGRHVAVGRIPISLRRLVAGGRV